MPKHLDAKYTPEPPGTTTTLVPLTELEMQHIRLHISPNHQLCGYATGRALDRKLAIGLLDLQATEDLQALYADVRRVMREDEIKAGCHDGTMPAD